MGQIVFCHHKQARGVLIDAVDDAGAQDSVDAGQALPSGVEQAVDQGVVPMPSCRMDDQTLGLVDHQEILVFIGNFQIHFGGGYIQGLRLWKLHLNHVS